MNPRPTRPTAVPLEKLQEAAALYAHLEKQHPEAWALLQRVIKWSRRIGYKNAARLILHEQTPERLKHLA